MGWLYLKRDQNLSGQRVSAFHSHQALTFTTQRVSAFHSHRALTSTTPPKVPYQGHQRSVPWSVLSDQFSFLNGLCTFLTWLPGHGTLLVFFLRCRQFLLGLFSPRRFPFSTPKFLMMEYSRVQSQILFSLVFGEYIQPHCYTYLLHKPGNNPNVHQCENRFINWYMNSL